MSRIQRIFYTIVSVLCLFTWVSTANAMEQQVITLEIGRGAVISVDPNAEDIIVVNQDVVDINSPKPGRIALFAKTVGETDIFALDFAGNVVFSSTIRTFHQKTEINRMLEERFPDQEISLNSANGSILLEGEVDNPLVARDIQQSIAPFLQDEERVVNKLSSRMPTTVRLEVHLVEMQRTIDDALGINWQGLLNKGEFAVSLFSGRGFEAAVDAASGGGIAAAYSGANANLGFAVDWLEQRGYASVLSKPTLVALSGESAEFRAGQRIPVPTTISGEGEVGSSNFGVTYEFFGLSLNFRPTIISNEELYLTVQVESSQILDQLYEVSGSGLPAISSQSFSTTLTVQIGQSIAIAGLMQSSDRQSLDRLPILGRLPVLGKVFSSQRFRNNQSEVVAIITPYLNGTTESQRQTAEMVKPLSNMEYLMMSQDGQQGSRVAPADMKRLPAKAGFSY